MFDLADFFTQDVLPDTTLKGFVFPLFLKLRAFHLLGKYVNHHTTESQLLDKQEITNNKY